MEYLATINLVPSKLDKEVLQFFFGRNRHLRNIVFHASYLFSDKTVFYVSILLRPLCNSKKRGNFMCRNVEIKNMTIVDVHFLICLTLFYIRRKW